ncbi:MAG: hypothetical protein NC935_07925 [Candidatus Omnitrophica bacterium]|nr:hypothetical protein [Candidatus Omnitrophota bacterium]
MGIHILETSEVEEAGRLVNSSGGDWGWVTIVLRDDDFDHKKWQKFMDDCRRLHLIPIIRVATHLENGVWLKPKAEELDKWVNFLNSLNWPVKQQVVAVFNEPNHSKEWGGEINPQEYSLILEKMITLFKKANENFVILNAGLDQAADGKNGTMKEELFLQKMFEFNKNIFNQLDGWASHSYPNHGFIGDPDDKGRGSIKGYEWELGWLKNHSLVKNWDVYLTETGWPHSEGETKEGPFFESKKISQFFIKAFDYWIKDNRVKAITPFVLNYPQPPFDHFSWLKSNGDKYDQYNEVLAMPKVKGQPEQIEKYEILAIKMMDLLPTNWVYRGEIKIKNTGQWIIGENKPFVLDLKEEYQGSKITQHPRLKEGELVFPQEEKNLEFVLQTGTQSGEFKLKIGNKDYSFYVFKPFEWKNKKVSLWRQILTKIKLEWKKIITKN